MRKKENKIFTITPHNKKDKKLVEMAEKFLNYSPTFRKLIEEEYKKAFDRIIYGELK